MARRFESVACSQPFCSARPAAAMTVVRVAAQMCIRRSSGLLRGRGFAITGLCIWFAVLLGLFVYFVVLPWWDIQR